MKEKLRLVVLGSLSAVLCLSQISPSTPSASHTEGTRGQASPALSHSSPEKIAGTAASRTSFTAQMHFRDVGAQAGLTTVPHSSSVRRYMLETMGGGVIVLFDCDNDGKLDMAVVNDSTIDQYLHGGDPMVTLYHQGHDFRAGSLHSSM